MASKINHVAIVSQQYTLLAAYYRAIFKMKQSDKDRRADAMDQAKPGQAHRNPVEAVRRSGVERHLARI